MEGSRIRLVPDRLQNDARSGALLLQRARDGGGGGRRGRGDVWEKYLYLDMHINITTTLALRFREKRATILAVLAYLISCHGCAIPTEYEWRGKDRHQLADDEGERNKR